MSKQIISNLFMVFKDWRYSLLGIIIFLCFQLIFYAFTNTALTIGNLGMTYFVVQTVTQSLIALLFAIFVPISVYKIVLFSDFSVKENTNSFIGSIMTVIVAGCPTCSVTLASYIGLAGVFSIFPFYGLELKVITVPILLWAIYSVLKNLTACEINLSKRKSVAELVPVEEEK
jgi:hypothetical protein